MRESGKKKGGISVTPFLPSSVFPFLLFLPLFLTCLLVLPAQAQAPDTTALPPVGFPGAEPGLVVGDTMLARSPEPDVPALLGALPGSFVYEFGAIGWPDGWSPFGLNPRHISLYLNGLPFDDPVTGRPRYDLLPLAFLEPLRVQAGYGGAPMAVQARVRALDVQQPLTELSYRASNTGLQSGMALHTQQRRRPLFGNEGLLGLLFGYGGHASAGEYPGSRLRRGRQLLGRLRYQQPAWSLELSALHNRRSIGAHTGVEPIPGLPFESVYIRFDARVRNPEARRRTVRSDFAMTARARVLPVLREPLTATAFWTKAFFQYRQPGDTLDTRMHRLGGRVQQRLVLGAHHMRLLAEGWTDRLHRSHALPDSLGLSRTTAHVTFRDDLPLGRLSMMLEGGLHRVGTRTFPAATLMASYHAGPLNGFAEGMYAGQTASWVEEYGFGDFLQSPGAVPQSRVMQGRTGLTLQSGAFEVTVFGWRRTVLRPFDLFETAAEDSVVLQVLSAPLHHAGLGADAGWRRRAERGFYILAQPSFIQLLNDTASPQHVQVDAALPAFFGSGRIGARYKLFRGDLDLDVSLRGRFWTELRSRVLHTPTGLLALPPVDARIFPASSALDVVLVGGVRTATFFIAYENVLSGTDLLTGNLIVPVYPLPERRLRFGIFWPIRN